MFHKLTVLFITIVTLLTGLTQSNVATASSLKEYQDDTLHILLIFSNKGSTESVNTKKIDLLLNHFTSNVQIVSDYDVKQADFSKATHVFYYGEDEQKVNSNAIHLLERFTRPVVIIGNNIEQIPSFKSFQQTDTVKINGIGISDEANNKTLLKYPIKMKQIESTEKMDTLLYGYKDDNGYPLLVKKEKQYVFALNIVEDVLKYYFAEVLHEILPNNHPSEHVAYIRLEDIHPLADEKKLLDVGKYLNERNIPYILVVIPVYITPGTGERVHLSDSPKLVEVLQQLQAAGGTVISHGFTHQYRDSETGEGFEFWDVENGQFIISSEPMEDIEKIKSQDLFASKEEYNSYIEQLREKEKQYMDKRLIDSIQALVSMDLYPLAFEAPHYTLSQHGYSIVSNYFSSIFGQVQLSDQDWELMDAPPYVTTARFLNGMNLFPETIGFVNTELNHPFVEVRKQLERTLVVRDSMIGGFYHPYLGVEYLPEFLAAYESVPNLTWLDLKKTEQFVHTFKVEVSSDGTNIHVIDDTNWLDDFLRENKFTLLEKVLWGITVLVFTFIILFFIFTVYLRTQVRKRLFKERKENG